MCFWGWKSAKLISVLKLTRQIFIKVLQKKFRKTWNLTFFRILVKYCGSDFNLSGKSLRLLSTWNGSEMYSRAFKKYFLGIPKASLHTYNTIQDHLEVVEKITKNHFSKSIFLLRAQRAKINCFGVPIFNLCQIFFEVRCWTRKRDEDSEAGWELFWGKS